MNGEQRGLSRVQGTRRYRAMSWVDKQPRTTVPEQEPANLKAEVLGEHAR